MSKILFEWDESKNQANLEKHGISFSVAQYVFADPKHIVLEDLEHSIVEKRYYCIGKIDNEIVTVRFTYRANNIRIIGAGYWRRGKRIYENENG